MREPHRVLLSPLITEKSNLQKEMMNQLAFEVDRRANKIEIRQAVEQAFNVKVMKVRTINMMGKKKRLGRFIGRRPNWKKAVVTLAPGDRVDFFEGV
ncbi:MAG: 50S ribosomal protein L23 [Thermodesulfobacteriota bacterium]|nr:50S ribosomal protein L23 [Thermodesulfobacteriota bacterium]